MPTYLAPGVYVEEVASSQKSLSSAPTAIAAFVGFTGRRPTDDPKDPDGIQPRLVTSWLQFEELYGGFAEGCMLPQSIFGYFANGGQLAYVCSIPHTQPAAEPSTVALPAADRALGAPVTITSTEDGADLTVVVQPADIDDEEAPEGPAPFDLLVLEGDTVIERHEGLSLDGARSVEKVVNAASKKVKVKTSVAKDVDLSSMLESLRAGSYPLAKPAPLPVPVSGKAFAGSETGRHGINGLVIADEVTMVIVPDLVTAATKDDGTIDLKLWKSVQTALISHCEQQANRVAVLDAPPGMSPQQVKEWRTDEAMFDTGFAAFYYPWIRVDDPFATNGSSDGMLIPPSGHIAGVWARVDESRGVWKAPANETMRGVLDVERQITKNDQAVLNPIGINCIRPFGTRGIRIWGARTLSSDSDWRYLNVRRLFNMIETTILHGTQYVVFEPNDMGTWEGVKRTVSSFLRTLWQDGALFGATPEQAFFVKCDEETNPPAARDEGRLVVEVGIAPVKPAEFVIFRISQFKDQSDA